MSTPSSVAVRRTTVAAVLLVAAVAAVMSYAHMQYVAQREGEGWRSLLLPLSVDGLMVAASMVLLARHRAGLPGGVLPWTALLAGVGASLAANVAAAEPTTTARIVAAWPAVAFAVAFELLLQQHRPLVTEDTPTATESRSAPDEHGRRDDLSPSTRSFASVSALPRAVPADTEPAPAVAPTAPARGPAGGDAALATRAAALIAAADGRSPGRRVLARELGCTEHRARVLLEALSTNALSANGIGPAAAGGPR